MQKMEINPDVTSHETDSQRTMTTLGQLLLSLGGETSEIGKNVIFKLKKWQL